MGATTSDLKFQIVLYKFVPINFLDANETKANYSFFVFTQKSNNYCCDFFLLKGGPP